MFITFITSSDRLLVQELVCLIADRYDGNNSHIKKEDHLS